MILLIAITLTNSLSNDKINNDIYNSRANNNNNNNDNDNSIHPVRTLSSRSPSLVIIINIPDDRNFLNVTLLAIAPQYFATPYPLEKNLTSIRSLILRLIWI